MHLVTPSASRHAHVLFARRDGRLFFVIPWLGYSLVGTTDTDYHGDPADAAATEEDVELPGRRGAAVPFPTARFDEIYYTWAGVRALVRVEHVERRQGLAQARPARSRAARRRGRHRVGRRRQDHRLSRHRRGSRRPGGAQSSASRRAATRSPQLRPLPGGHLADLETYVERRALAARAGARTRSRAGRPPRRDLRLAGAERCWRAPNAIRGWPQRVCPHQPTHRRPARPRRRRRVGAVAGRRAAAAHAARAATRARRSTAWTTSPTTWPTCSAGTPPSARARSRPTGARSSRCAASVAPPRRMTA